jgi:hypothetical protein
VDYALCLGGRREQFSWFTKTVSLIEGIQCCSCDTKTVVSAYDALCDHTHPLVSVRQILADSCDDTPQSHRNGKAGGHRSYYRSCQGVYRGSYEYLSKSTIFLSCSGSRSRLPIYLHHCYCNMASDIAQDLTYTASLYQTSGCSYRIAYFIQSWQLYDYPTCSKANLQGVGRPQISYPASQPIYLTKVGTAFSGNLSTVWSPRGRLWCSGWEAH